MGRKKKAQEEKKYDDLPFDVQAFQSATQLFSDAEVGFYLRLLMYNWTEKSIPDDPIRIFRMPGAMPGEGFKGSKNLDGTRGYTPGTPQVHPDVPAGTEIVPDEHPIFSHEREKMWEFLKKKFRKGPNGGLVNSRLEASRKDNEAYSEMQRQKSIKAVLAKKKKREEQQQNRTIPASLNGHENNPQNNGTRGYTPGSTWGVPRVGTPTRFPVLFFNNILNTNTGIGRFFGEKINFGVLKPAPILENGTRGYTPGTPVGAITGTQFVESPGTWDAGLPETYQRYYRMSWEELHKLGGSVGKGVSVDSLKVWRQFVKFMAENGYDDFFRMKFLSPKDFSNLQQRGFTQNLWQPILNQMLGTGVKPEQNPFFRIPQFCIWNKTPLKEGIVDPQTQQKTADQWSSIDKAQLKKMEEMQASGKLSKDEFDYFIKNRKPGLSTKQIMGGYNPKE